MKISVIMPVYNAEKFLRFAVESVLEAAKRFDGETELICVDDGSTDASPAVLATYPSVKVIHKANGGEGSARNAGMDVATGELIAFLDADDVIHPQGLALIASAYEKTGADVIRYGWAAVTEHGRPFEPLPGVECVREVDLAARTESTVRFCAVGCVTVVSRARCGDVRFCSLPQGADLVFVMDCLLRSRKTVFVDAPILHYLMHSNSISKKLSTGLMTGTCGYIPELVERCAKLGEGRQAAADTRRYMYNLLFRYLAGAWRLFEDAEDRELVRRAFWDALRRLLVREDFFPAFRRRLVQLATGAESLVLLKVLVAWPYRLERKIFL